MDDTPTFDIAYTFNFTAMEPSRVLRKVRPVPRSETFTVHVLSVTSAQAPVVMRVPDDAYHANPAHTATLRGYAGRLYAPQPHAHTDTYPWEVTVYAGTDAFPDRVVEPADFVDARTRAERIDGLIEQYEHFLVIDGGVWAVTDEPVYEIITEGEDGEFGGTSLVIHRRGLDPSRVHPATDHTAAVVHAIEVAADRDDGWSIPILIETEAIDVLDPAYVRTSSRVDARASNEIAMLDLIDQAKAILHATDGRDWWRRINTAMTALAKARAIAYEQLR